MVPSVLSYGNQYTFKLYRFIFLIQKLLYYFLKIYNTVNKIGLLYTIFTSTLIILRLLSTIINISKSLHYYSRV